MKKINDFIKSKKGVISILSIIFILVLILNFLTIWAADDYAFYNNVWLEEESFSILQAFERSKAFYLAWTGRFLSTFINYIILYFPKPIFNILNSGVYTLLIYIIYKIIKKDKQENGFQILSIFLLTWLLVPSIGQVFFWQIGSVIYLWMYTLVAALLLLYINIIKKDIEIKDNIKNLILIPLLALLAGNGFETNSIILLVFLTLIILYNKFILKQKNPKWSIVAYITSIIGSCTNFFSPGNAVRMTQMGGTGENLITKIEYGIGPWFYNGIFRSKIFITFTVLILAYIVYILAKKEKINKKILFTLFTTGLFLGSFILIISMLLPPNYSEFLVWFYPNCLKFWFLLAIVLILMITMIISFIINRKELLDKTDSKTNYITLILTISALIGIASYIMTPTAWPRSYMGMSITLIIAIVYIVNRTEYKNKYFLPIIISIMLLISTGIYIVTLYDAYKATKWNTNTQKTIEEKISNGENIIYVDTFMSHNSYNGASIEKWVIPIEEGENISPDYEWINIAITKYYFKDKNAWQNGKRIIGK